MEHDSWGWWLSGRHGRGGRRWGPPPPPAPPFPPWFFDMFGERPPRAERGEVRLLILDALADKGRHGYDVIQVIGEKSGGAYRPSPGTIYPTLQMLEEMGHVRTTEQDGRKIYELTDAGRQELEAHREEVEDAYERMGGGASHADFHELAHMLRRLMRGVRRGLRHGRLGPSRWKEIESILQEAMERIEKVLERD
jgi:DNA-binding PadR family transcriptional regulator